MKALKKSQHQAVQKKHEQEQAAKIKAAMAGPSNIEGGGEAAKKVKKPYRRKFGDYRWDYVLKCKHDLNVDNAAHYTNESLAAAEGTHRGNCPFCNLINKETNRFLEEEIEKKARSRLEGE